MYLLPSLRPSTLEEIARQPDDTERLAKRETEQIAKVRPTLPGTKGIAHVVHVADVAWEPLETGLIDL